MKVTTIDGQDLYLGFSFDNKKSPSITSCFLKTKDRKLVAEVTVIKHHSQPQLGGQGQTDRFGRIISVQKANDTIRKFALQKLMDKYFADRDLKATRAKFWDAYINRNRKIEAVVDDNVFVGNGQ